MTLHYSSAFWIESGFDPPILQSFEGILEVPYREDPHEAHAEGLRMLREWHGREPDMVVIGSEVTHQRMTI